MTPLLKIRTLGSTLEPTLHLRRNQRWFRICHRKLLRSTKTFKINYPALCSIINSNEFSCTEKHSSINFTQLLSKVGTHGQVGDYLI